MSERKIFVRRRNERLHSASVFEPVFTETATAHCNSWGLCGFVTLDGNCASCTWRRANSADCLQLFPQLHSAMPSFNQLSRRRSGGRHPSIVWRAIPYKGRRGSTADYLILPYWRVVQSSRVALFEPSTMSTVAYALFVAYALTSCGASAQILCPYSLYTSPSKSPFHIQCCF